MNGLELVDILGEGGRIELTFLTSAFFFLSSVFKNTMANLPPASRDFPDVSDRFVVVVIFR